MRLRLLGTLCAALWISGCKDQERPAIADGQLFAHPNQVSFERVALYSARSKEVELTNQGRSSLRIDEILVEGTEGVYRPETDAEVPFFLESGERRFIKVWFTPQQAGDASAFLIFRTDNRDAPDFKVPVNGFGVDARARLGTEVLDFGRIEAQASKTQPLELTNDSALPVRARVTPVGQDRDEFVPAEVWLQPGERRQIKVPFLPQRVGTKQVSLAVETCEGCPETHVNVLAVALDRAVIAEPASVDFGPVPVDGDERRTVRVRNISTEPMEVLGVKLADRTDPSFLGGTGGGFWLGPDETRDFQLGYQPTHMGEALGAFELRVRSTRNPTTAIPLRGHGGSPELCVSPGNQDFGLKPVGSKNAVTVHIRNCGASPLEVTDVRLDPSGAHNDQFSRGPGVFPRTLAAGESLQVKAFYEPTRAGDARTSLVISSTAYSAQNVTVPLSGRAEVFPPCRLEVSPPVVDFGNILPGRGAVLGAKVKNVGGDLCAVKNIRLSQDAGGAFRLPGGMLDGAVLWPGDAFAFQIAFVAPATGGEFTGLVAMEVADPARPVFELPLLASSEQSCIVPAPFFVDFGTALPICPPAPRTVTYMNQCSTAATLGDVRIGMGTTDGEFVFTASPGGLPLSLAQGQTYSVEVEYRAQAYGQNYSPLFADVPGLRKPMMVPLLGEASSRTAKVDRFVQQDGSKVDVLFVVDNTASMVEEHPRLQAALPAFVDAALRKGVNLNVAVTTTGIEAVSGACPGGALGGEAGRLFPADNSSQRILNQATPDLANRLRQNANVGQCANVEQGLEAARRALTPPLSDSADAPGTPLPADGNAGFLRAEAGLAVVVISDEDDHSPEAVDVYVRALQSVKGGNQPQRATLFAIAPTGAACSTAGGVGTRLEQAALRTGGGVLDICANDFAPLLQSVAQKAFGPQDRFPLSESPDATGITVTVDGTALSTGWRYDRAANVVVFDSSPAPGSRVEISYQKSCGN